MRLAMFARMMSGAWGRLIEESCRLPAAHGEFDIRADRRLQMPAVVVSPAYPVQVRGGILFVGIPK